MRGRRVAIAGVAIVLCLVLGGMLSRCGRPEAKGRGPRAEPIDSPADGSKEPGGASRANATEAGALEAAIRFATGSQRWLFMTDVEIRAEVDELATPETAADLGEQLAEMAALARLELDNSTGNVWWLVRPLATRIDHLSNRTARIEVWTVSVLAAAEVAAPQSEWTTVQVDLEWSGDAWLVDDVRDSAGPTPMPGPEDDPWDASSFDEGLQGFERIDRGSGS